MKPFRYVEPATLAEASALLLQHAGQASLLAGGTDLLVEIKEQLRSPEIVINIKNLPELRGLEFDPARGLFIGAMATARSIELSPLVQQHYPGLAQAARELGSIQVRNRATIVGNVCRASPSADSLPPLLADAARIHLHGAAGPRELALGEFFTGPGRTALHPGEIVTGIQLPAPQAGSGKSYIKHGRRKAMELATVGVAVSLQLRQGVLSEIAIVLGAVAPTAVHAPRTEALLRGRGITPALLAEAGTMAMQECTPISNVRASADYRRDMVGVLVQRALVQALAHAGHTLPFTPPANQNMQEGS
jgi:carbon-monoxide dehydrogenase medium subunit